MALSNDEFAKFYAEVEVKLFNFALRWTWSPSLAEDLMHEAFLRLWKKRDGIDVSTARGLIFKTVQNLALNERRNRKFREAVPLLSFVLPSRHADLESEFIERENMKSLKDSLEKLPLELRETLLLCEFSEMSQKDIGVVLGIPEGTVASRRNRALKLLKEISNG